MNKTTTFTAAEAATAFLDRLEAKELDSFMELWAENAEQINPFAPDNFPPRYEGKDKIREQYNMLVSQFGKVRFVEREMIPTPDKNRAIALFKGQIDFADKDGAYNNDYICLFEVNEAGLIVRYTEYFNPIVLAKAFDLSFDL